MSRSSLELSFPLESNDAICHSLSFRRRSSFVVGNKPCLLLSPSESVRLGVQQTPLTMVTDRCSLSDCPQAIHEELLSNWPSKFSCLFWQL